MAKLRFKDYAHDSYEDSETVEHLTETYAWDKATAKQYAENHKPMYEVEGEFEYDTETGELRVLSAVVGGVRLVPDETA
jgi:hypothetical protein